MDKNLVMQKVDLVSLAQKIGTPLMVYDQEKIEQKLEQFQTSFKSDVFHTHILYASKAFQCIAMLDLVNAHGCCLDVVSGGELDQAIHAGFPMEKVYFHGNNKTLEELVMALRAQVGCIIVDNEEECSALCELASELSCGCHVMIRVNPGIEAHTHEYIVTAHIDSKFGVSIQEMDVISHMIHMVEEQPHLKFIGFHAHIGSQIFDEHAYVAEIETLCNFMAKVENRCNIKIPACNLGGGFAAFYTDQDQPIEVSRICEVILNTCKKAKEQYQLSFTDIMIEPGRSIVAEAGMSLYTVGWQKKTPHRHYVFVDGGMSDNIRPALYQAAYSCDIINRLDEEKTQLVTVAGKCCESGDVLVQDVKLPQCKSGDILAIYTTGAYGYSMASNYNKAGRPPVVFIKDGNVRLVIRKETYEDMRSYECDEELSI